MCIRDSRDTALLTSIGSSICGAAAVLGAEPVVKSKPYKAAVAVSTVVIFGTGHGFLHGGFMMQGTGVEPCNAQDVYKRQV